MFNQAAQDAANRQAELERIRKSFENVSTSSLSSVSNGGAVGQQITQLQKLQEEYSNISEPINQAQSAYSALEDALNNGAINNDQFAESLKEFKMRLLQQVVRLNNGVKL